LKRVLVVDDEPQIHRFLKPALVASDFEVLTSQTAREALRLIRAREPDLIILDLGLPDADGKKVIAQVRTFSRVPIVVLSARGSEGEKVEALDMGADDYVEKPFGIAELLARIRTALRRHLVEADTQAESYQVYGLSVDVTARVVKLDGEPVRLTPKEYDLLLQLMRNAGRVLTHRQLLAAVWGPAHLQDVQYLRVAIGQLRAKIEKDPRNPRLIINEPAVGYRFIADQRA
jgi:two-component system KDP operon response regulator KdpE